MKLKESWQQFSEAQVADFLRTGYEGVHHPSRIKVLNLLHGMGSVLDVVCGTGVTFELLQEQRPELDYVGIDTTDKFIKAAKMRYPQHAHRFHHGSLYELHKPNRRFDAAVETVARPFKWAKKWRRYEASDAYSKPKAEMCQIKLGSACKISWLSTRCHKGENYGNRLTRGCCDDPMTVTYESGSS